ncbi:MAG: DNA-protecting protein DprA [Rhodomicrobium sp.]|nr:DNA-protecting protein DprA [Rhodomicrobium sp.]
MKAKSAKAPHQEQAPKAPDTYATLSESEKLAWLRLIRTPQIGGVTFWELLSHFGSAEAALEALPEFAKHGSRISPRSIPTAAAIAVELEKAASSGMALLAAGEPGYPHLLACVEVPPPLLYVKGAGSVWDRPPLAVVGSRHASAAGLKFAAEISAALGARGFAIVSGLARGIDAAAHRASLPFAACAVLPGGLDAIYPPEHSGLAAQIAENGLLISECPPGFAARSQDFPRRNRIISGSCLGVVIVEAAECSGSLITARLAAEQSREVFAVPGHPFEPRAAGTNRLIKEGAVFTTCADDVEQALEPLLAGWKNARPEKAFVPQVPEARIESISACSNNAVPPETVDFAGETAREVLKLLSLSPIDVDDLCRLSGLEARHVHAALLSLDLAGRIERRGLRQVALRP